MQCNNNNINIGGGQLFSPFFLQQPGYCSDRHVLMNLWHQDESLMFFVTIHDWFLLLRSCTAVQCTVDKNQYQNRLLSLKNHIGTRTNF